jgi:hypothetical protein
MSTVLSNTNETEINAMLENMVKKVSWLVINERYVEAVETMARESGISIARFSREIGIPDKSVASRKSKRLGKRGIPFTEMQALSKIGVNLKLFEDFKIDNVRDYLPREPVKISKKKLRESRRDKEQASLISDVAEIKDKLNILFRRLGIEENGGKAFSDPKIDH